jgi:hypothetical protein
MKASPIAPAANAFNCSRPIPVDLRVVSQSANSKAPSEQGSCICIQLRAAAPGIDICTMGRFGIRKENGQKNKDALSKSVSSAPARPAYQPMVRLGKMPSQ